MYISSMQSTDRKKRRFPLEIRSSVSEESNVPYLYLPPSSQPPTHAGGVSRPLRFPRFPSFSLFLPLAVLRVTLFCVIFGARRRKSPVLLYNRFAAVTGFELGLPKLENTFNSTRIPPLRIPAFAPFCAVFLSLYISFSPLSLFADLKKNLFKKAVHLHHCFRLVCPAVEVRGLASRGSFSQSVCVFLSWNGSLPFSLSGSPVHLFLLVRVRLTGFRTDALLWDVLSGCCHWSWSECWYHACDRRSFYRRTFSLCKTQFVSCWTALLRAIPNSSTALVGPLFSQAVNAYLVNYVFT